MYFFYYFIILVQNKIIIRSSLQFCNSLNVPIEVKCSEKSSSSILIVDPNTTIPIPLLCVMYNTQIRPCSEASEKAVSPSVKKLSNVCLNRFQ